MMDFPFLKLNNELTLPLDEFIMNYNFKNVFVESHVLKLFGFNRAGNKADLPVT